MQWPSSKMNLKVHWHDSELKFSKTPSVLVVEFPLDHGVVSHEYLD